MPSDSVYKVQNCNCAISLLPSLLLPHQDLACQITTSFPKVQPINRKGNEWIHPYASARLRSNKTHGIREQYWDICVLTICTHYSNALSTYDMPEVSFYTWKGRPFMPALSMVHITSASQLVASCDTYVPLCPIFFLWKIIKT